MKKAQVMRDKTVSMTPTKAMIIKSSAYDAF